MTSNPSPPPRGNVPIHPVSRWDSMEPSLVEILSLLDRAVSNLSNSRRSAPPETPVRTGLCEGGVAIVIEDTLGIAREVAADLRALGHPVLRVRHGVGSADVEGVNLQSGASVAALIERARTLGPIAAVVETSSLRSRIEDDDPPTTGDGDPHLLGRLLAATSGDLVRTATRAGACFVVVHTSSAVTDSASRKASLLESASKTLPGVRLQFLALDRDAEIEVMAAIVVRTVLAASPTRTIRSPCPLSSPAERGERQRGSSQAILLGAPDRSRWIELASALSTYVSQSSTLNLADLAANLHRGQPLYPLRVGVVANSPRDLLGKLDTAIDRIRRPSCRYIHDRRGLYWTDPTVRGTGPRTSCDEDRGGVPEEPRTSAPRPNQPLIPFPSARDWLHHEMASRFGHGFPVDLELLPLDRRSQGYPPLAQDATAKAPAEAIDTSQPRRSILHELIRLMDQALDHEAQVVLELLRA